MNTTNLNRDGITEWDNVWLKKAALAAAEANAAGTEEELNKAEQALMVGAMSRGFISLDEYDKLAHLDYDGLPGPDGNYYHHVYFYVNGERDPVLDVTCDIH